MQQHYFSARRILENAGYRIVLLTGSLEADRKREDKKTTVFNKRGLRKDVTSRPTRLSLFNRT